jgi:hypothetical protein
MVHIINEEDNRGREALSNLGRILDVPSVNQHLVSGNPDIEAYRLAKELGVQKVFGYSKLFLSIQKIISWIRSKLFKDKSRIVWKPHVIKR